jgi:hypothetical protein
MSLARNKLVNVKDRADGGYDAQCPICFGCGKDRKGDNLRVWADDSYKCICGCDTKEIFALAGNRDSLPSSGPALVIRPRHAPVRKPSTPFAWPELQHGTASDIRQLARLRDVNAESLQMMSERGILRFATFDGERAWVAVDPSLKNAQARLLNGERWHGIDCMSRSPRSDSGAVHGWPIGITAAASFGAIALVEGVPDFISVLHHAGCNGVESRVAPVMMPGAGVRIVDDALPLFAGKRVRVFVHDDTGAGAGAFASWCEQLLSAAAVVDGFSFDGLFQSDGRPVKDLNDLCRIGEDSWEEHRNAIESCMDFATEAICPE